MVKRVATHARIPWMIGKRLAIIKSSPANTTVPCSDPGSWSVRMTHAKGGCPMFRFSIRDVLWLTVVVAMGVGWLLDRRGLEAKVSKLKSDGQMRRAVDSADFGLR